MGTQIWVHGAVFALAIAQFFVFWYLYRRSGMSSTHQSGKRGATAVADGTSQVDDHRVACPNCGTLNTASFRFCEHCVEELPRHAQ
jgi:hypothetical protein